MARTLCRFLLFGTALANADVSSESLSVDDACLAGNETCDISLRQLRAVKAHEQEEVATYSGFTLTLNQDFKTPINLDTDPIWTWSDGGVKEGQVRFVKEAIRFQDGVMKIVVEPNPGIKTQSCSHAEKDFVSEKPFIGGELRTRHNQFRYGRYEVRMKAPNVRPGNSDINGNYVATMFVFKDSKHVHWREIDFETTGDRPNTVSTNILNADHTDRWSFAMQEQKQVHEAGNARATFHTYAFEWLPTGVTWYIDGKEVRRQGHGKLPVPDRAGKVMMNLWVFGPRASFGGKHIENNKYPLVAEYEYFRFYKWDGDKDYPCAGFGKDCLTPDDLYLSGNNPCDGELQTGLKDGQPVCKATCDQ